MIQNALKWWHKSTKTKNVTTFNNSWKFNLIHRVMAIRKDWFDFNRLFLPKIFNQNQNHFLVLWHRYTFLSSHKSTYDKNSTSHKTINQQISMQMGSISRVESKRPSTTWPKYKCFWCSLFFPLSNFICHLNLLYY